MKKLMIIVAAAITFCLAACAQNNQKQKDMDKKVIVTYFSATGTTERVAKEIAKAAKADILEIEPAKPYTSADLDWTDNKSRSSVEMHDLAFRPAIKDVDKNLAGYDVIFIGYPIWWDLAPTAVNTFIESNSLNGKTVIPFATSGGSGVRNSVLQLKKQYPDINWKDGKLLNSPSAETINKWLESLSL